MNHLHGHIGRAQRPWPRDPGIAEPVHRVVGFEMISRTIRNDDVSLHEFPRWFTGAHRIEVTSI